MSRCLDSKLPSSLVRYLTWLESDLIVGLNDSRLKAFSPQFWQSFARLASDVSGMLLAFSLQYCDKFMLGKIGGRAMSVDPLSTLGKRLREFRDRVGWSQEDLAEHARVSGGTISNWEAGMTRSPHPHTRRKIVEALKVEWKRLGLPAQETLEVLMGGHTDQYPVLTSAVQDGIAGTVDPALEFAQLIRSHKGADISRYPGTGWDDAISLQNCPDLLEDRPGLEKGWAVSAVQLYQDDSETFALPARYKESYGQYVAEQYDDKGFYDDGEKFMLLYNPSSSSDSPTLRLHTRSTRWSEFQYYGDTIARVATQRRLLIDELIVGPSLCAHFPHSLCMGMVVITDDMKILRIKRSGKVINSRNLWAVSIDEQLSRSDLEGGETSVVTNWARRLLWEELALGTNRYEMDNIRISSVFLETDILNTSLSACAKLEIDSTTLDTLLQGPRPDDEEFLMWDFLELRQDILLQEMIRPSRAYHSTSRYHMLMTLLRFFGLPKG
jgi:transcriptional regulator with XRE-family HTH domain